MTSPIKVQDDFNKEFKNVLKMKYQEQSNLITMQDLEILAKEEQMQSVTSEQTT